MRDLPRLLQSDNPKTPNTTAGSLPTELTEETFSTYCKMVEMLFAVRLSASQKATGRKILQDYFFQKNTKGIRSVQSAVEEYNSLLKKDPTERIFAIRRELPASLREIRENPDGQEAEAKWLLSVYHAAHPTIAPGDPPLTRDVADAWIGMDHFLRAQLWGHKVSPITPIIRARYDRKMAVRWKTFPAKKRYLYMRLPAELMEIKHKWPQVPERDRRSYQFKILDEPDKRDVLLEEVDNPFKKP